MNYNETHTVVIALRCLHTDPPQNIKIAHVTYYQQLKNSAKTLEYGDLMNEEGVCIIIQVSSSDAFEQVISGDPALASGYYEIRHIIPLQAISYID